MNAISLDSAIVVTGISKRTLWRRLSDGQIRRLDNDERGRAMLVFDDLVPLLSIAVDPVDYELFMEADAGNAHAQNDLALLYLDADKPEVAVYWLQAATSNQQPATSNQQPATSNQQPATSNQHLVWMPCITLPSFILKVLAFPKMRTPALCG